MRCSIGAQAGRTDRSAPPTARRHPVAQGRVEVTEEDENEEEHRQRPKPAVVAGFDRAAEGSGAVRAARRQGAGRPAQCAGSTRSPALAARAEKRPGRKPEAIRARLAEQVTTLLGTGDRFDADRLHQEAFCLPARPISAKSSTGSPPMSAQAKKLSPTAGRSAAGSIFCRRNSIANRIPFAPRPMTSNSPISALSSRASSSSSASRCRTWNEPDQRRGIMLVLSSPSGAGKTTLTRSLIETDRNLKLSISVTTRPQAAQRSRRRALPFRLAQPLRGDAPTGELLELAEVYGNLYGTPREPVEKALARGTTCCSTSTGKARSNFMQKCALTSSVSSCCHRRPRAGARLERRAQDNPATSIRRRLDKAADEMSHWAEYDYVLVNRDLDQAFTRLARHSHGGAGQKAWPREVRKARQRLAGRPQDNQPIAREGIGQLHEAFHRDLLGARGWLDSGLREQRCRHRRRATSGFGAASCGAGRRRLR